MIKTIRLYRPGDERGIVKLFQEVFGREMSLEEWIWKYKGQGNEKVYSSIAVNDEDEIIGHYGGMPHRMRYRGMDCKGLSICDVMSHPKFRGFKLFKDLATLVPEEASRDGFILGYGFPNERAFRLPEKLGLYEKIEDISEAGKEVQLHNNLDRYVYRFFPMRYDDDRINGLWEKLKSRIHLAVVRDREYMGWRYQRHPLFSYELWGFGKRWGTRLEGLAVLRREKERMLLIDFVCPLDYLSTLFQKIENYVCTTGIKSLVFWLPEYLQELVASQGFSLYPAGTAIPRTTHERTLTKAEIEGKFFYTMGDTDFL